MAPSDASDQTRLSTAACWHLLESQEVGRLALVDDDGVPDIFPVNYVAYEGAVYIRSAPDIKLVRVASHPVAAFEVDGGDAEERWSVVLRGTVARAVSETEIARSGVGRLAPWSPRYKPHVIRVTPASVTGRRFAKRPEAAPEAGRSDPDPRRGDPDPRRGGTDPHRGDGTPTTSAARAGTRPVSIPSHRPDRSPRHPEAPQSDG